MENAVLYTMDRVMNEDDIFCKCEKCKLDIAAIALNNLPPKYVVTKKGEVYTKIDEMERQFEVNVIKEVTKAINIVSKKPHHTVED